MSLLVLHWDISQTGKRFQTSDFNFYDSKGKEYKDHILFDVKYRDFYGCNDRSTLRYL